MNNNLTIIKKENVLGKDFTIYGDIENPLFLAKDVAAMIEHSNVSSMLKSVDEDEKVISNVYTLGGSQESWFLTEYGLYEVLMQSRKPVAKEFKSRVKEILRDLRRTGCVITESATTESIDYQAKYGKYRIRKTFSNTKDPRAEYEQFAELSKAEREAKRIDNSERIKCCNIIIDTLQTKVADEVQQMRPSELLSIQELIVDVQNDVIKLNNKMRGGVKSSLTKRIKKLELENEQLKNQSCEELDWKLINNHGFTENCKLEYSPELKRMVRTKAFNCWKNNFDYSDFRPLNCDTSKQMIIYLHFGKLEKFDTTNLEKTVIDIISEWYDFNDNLIVSKNTTSEIVESYSDGFIYFDLINVSDDDILN